MTNERSAPADRSVALAQSAWSRFWFTPIPTTGLKCLRVLCGLLFFFWLLSFAGHQVEIFSLNGWLDQETFRELRGQDLAPAPIGWSMLYLAGDSIAIFQALYWGSLVVFMLFALGVATRLTSVLTWVIVVSFFANPVTRYEGDCLLGILAFYLMLGHLLVGQWTGKLSILQRLLGAGDDFVLAPWLFPRQGSARPASHGANLMMRLLQIHVAVVIVTSALHKLQIADWWAGVALWYPLHPTFKTTLDSLKAESANRDFTLFYLSVAQYAVLAWQLGFPVFAWRTGKWRVLLLGGAGIGWLGAFFLLGAPLFGPFLLLGSLSFLCPDEWAWAIERMGAKFARTAQTAAAPAPKKMVMAAAKESIKK